METALPGRAVPRPDNSAEVVMSPEGEGADPAEGAEVSVAALKEENEQLRRAIHAHATVDQAIGIIVAVGRHTPEEGWNILREVSMNTNVKLREVAEALIEWGCSGDLSAGIRAELERRLDRHRGDSACGDRRPPAS
ncbi:ANTAR domain-containing protein [Streptomyces sp. cg35]|uniref:ANTAR domain-containing protein n=1 Tax=Streptomyces sp. cg35 TaxID=3421650 RepID=UPI003D16DD6F